jgi:acyl-CoA-dependent ceramide synthase
MSNGFAGISMTTLAMLLALHNLYPSLRPYTQPFFQLSYYDAASNSYVQGWEDVYFVFSAAVALTGIRAIVIEWMIQPMARSAGLKRKQAVRVAEQSWNAMYYSFIWGVGMVRLVDIMLFEVVVTDCCFVAVSLEEFPLLG